MTSTVPHAAELDEILTSVGAPDDAEWHQELFTASAAVDRANGFLYVALADDMHDADWMAMLDLVTVTVGFEEPGVCEDLGNAHVWKYQVPKALVGA